MIVILFAHFHTYKDASMYNCSTRLVSEYLFNRPTEDCTTIHGKS